MEGNIYIIDNQKKLIRQAVHIPQEMMHSLKRIDSDMRLDDIPLNDFDDLKETFSFFEGDPYQLNITAENWRQKQSSWIDKDSLDEIHLKQELQKKKRRIIGLCIKKENINYYFNISSWNTIKDKTIFDLLNSDGNYISRTDNILKINYGINMPEYATAIYDHLNEKLVVFNPEKLGKLFNIDGKYKGQAEMILDNIKNNRFSINNCSVKIESESDINQIEEYVLQSKQLCKKMNKLSEMNLDNIKTQKMNEIFDLYSKDKKEKNYVNHIEPVKIKDNEMILNIKNIKTFIDVCSDSMYRKMLSEKIGIEN